MFNSKLKKQIESLEDRIWQLENPPKYKVGDKIDKVWIVTKVNFACETGFSFEYHTFVENQRGWYYSLTNIKTGKTKTI